MAGKGELMMARGVEERAESQKHEQIVCSNKEFKCK